MTAMRRSKALEEVGYDPASRTLRVRFRNGGAYDYRDVAPEVFDGLLHSEHPWTDWREVVLSHDHSRLD